MPMILHAASRQQPIATSFPASRTNHRRAGLTRPFLRCADRRLVAVESDPSIALRGQETQMVIEGSELLELLIGLAPYAAQKIDLIPVSAHYDSVPFQSATVDDDDEDEDEEDDDLDEDDDLLDDDDDEDLGDDEDEEDEEEDEYEDLDDGDEEDDDDEDDE